MSSLLMSSMPSIPGISVGWSHVSRSACISTTSGSCPPCIPRGQLDDLGSGTGQGLQSESRHLDRLIVVGDHAPGKHDVGVVEGCRPREPVPMWGVAPAGRQPEGGDDEGHEYETETMLHGFLFRDGMSQSATTTQCSITLPLPAGVDSEDTPRDTPGPWWSPRLTHPTPAGPTWTGIQPHDSTTRRDTRSRRPPGALGTQRATTPSDVIEQMQTDLAYTSIATVLGRLCDKGLVERRREGAADSFTAPWSPKPN